MTSTQIPLWPPLPALALLRRGTANPPYPLDRPDCRVYAKARHGLWLGVRALGLRAGDTILVPAYHQGSEIEAFHRAGLSLSYYEVDDELRVDVEALDPLVTGTTRALHVIHYWGFPQDIVRLRTWCDDRGLLLIEDAAQALLASRGDRAVGSLGDLAVFCLYKAFGLPDGAAAVCRAELPRPTGRPAWGVQGVARRAGSGLALRSRWFALVESALGRASESDRPFGDFLAGELELGDPFSPPSRMTRLLCDRVVDSAAAGARRSHYSWLLDRLGEHVPPAFRRLPDGAVPIAFPIEHDDSSRLAVALERLGVRTGRLWPTWHPTLDLSSFPVARRYRERVLGLPVHQELRPHDLERIAVAAHRGLGA